MGKQRHLRRLVAVASDCALAGHVAIGFAAELAVRLLSGDGVGLSVALSAFNLIEVLIVAGAVRRWSRTWATPGPVAGPGRHRHRSTLSACAVSALFASAWFQVASDAPFLPNFLTGIRRTWSACGRGDADAGSPSQGDRLIDVPGQRWAFLGDMLLIAVVCAVVFYQSALSLAVSVYPPLLFAVFRHRFAGVVVGISLFGVIGGIATALGYGPLALVTPAMS